MFLTVAAAVAVLVVVCIMHVCFASRDHRLLSFIDHCIARCKWLSAEGRMCYRLACNDYRAPTPKIDAFPPRFDTGGLRVNAGVALPTN